MNWYELYRNVYLNLFSHDSFGMWNSDVGKSSFIFNEMDVGVLNRIIYFLPYKVEPIHVGFIYLWYFIKPLIYGVNYWRWLLNNFEKRINHWSYKILSMGVRLVLIRVVLTSLPVYSFSLVSIPKTILNRMRQLIFSFLWGSTGERNRLHLVN